MTQEPPNLEIDRLSFELGMINCFVEMVACGVKRLALSPPLSPDDYVKLVNASEEMARCFEIQSFLEKSLLVTDLQTADFTKGKWSILYYRDEATLEAYQALKLKKQQKEENGCYDRHARTEISRKFMRLLSYPDSVIEAKLSQAEPSDPYVHVECEENR